MIDQTIQDLERRIQNAKNLTPTQVRDLQALLDDLKREVSLLAQGQEAEEESVNRGLRASVAKFETSHPSLTLAANNIATYFSNLGI